MTSSCGACRRGEGSERESHEADWRRLLATRRAKKARARKNVTPVTPPVVSSPGLRPTPPGPRYPPPLKPPPPPTPPPPEKPPPPPGRATAGEATASRAAPTRTTSKGAQRRARRRRLTARLPRLRARRRRLRDGRGSARAPPPGLLSGGPRRHRPRRGARLVQSSPRLLSSSRPW